MGMKLFLESSLQDKFSISYLCTNVRASNDRKGRFDIQMVTAFVRFFSGLLSKLIRRQPVAVYYPVTATQLGWVGRDALCILICRLFGARIVIHLRASHFRSGFERFSKLARWLTQAACRRVDTAIVQADTLHSQFEGLVAPRRIKTLYQAIDTQLYDTDDLDSYDVGKIVFLGHLTQAKGYCDVVRAIQPVVEKFPFAEFYFAGTMRRGERNVLFNQITGERLQYEDPYSVERQLKESEVSSHYHNLGIVQGEEKKALLRSADFMVLPSYSEGFSRALIEAMSLGKPIVYTPVGAHSEVFDERMGVCVTPGDHSELVNAISKLLSDRSLRKQMSRHNYQYVRSHFDITIIAERLSCYLDEAAKDR